LYSYHLYLPFLNLVSEEGSPKARPSYEADDYSCPLRLHPVSSLLLRLICPFCGAFRLVLHMTLLLLAYTPLTQAPAASRCPLFSGQRFRALGWSEIHSPLPADHNLHRSVLWQPLGPLFWPAFFHHLHYSSRPLNFFGPLIFSSKHSEAELFSIASLVPPKK